jgi:D-lactate dehydrogenase (cytochrome)
MFPNMKLQVMDVAVPISKYPELIAFGREELKKHGATGAFVGHAGDGNIHITLPYKDDASLAKVKAINSAIVHKAIELGGTATGEHGVGIGKAAYMRDEHGEAVDVMWAIKHTLDPKGILNPDKVLPKS